MAHPEDENGGEIWEYEPSYPAKAAAAEEQIQPAVPLPASPAATGQSTVNGVFIPCIQSIIGIVLYSRFGWVTGQAGIGGAMLILITCTLVSFLTCLSMCAIATNGKIPAGGSYYMIARALGPAFGGSVGVLYFLGLVSSAAVYIVGAVETLLTNTSYGIVGNSFDIRLLGWIGVFLLWIINFVGMKYVTKTSLGITVILGLTLLSMYVGIFTAGMRSDDLPRGITGLSWGNLEDNLGEEYSEGSGFNTVTAIFFPAVTGIMAGCDRAGFLKTPSRSIPRGTLSAIGITTLLYLSFILLFGCVADREALKTELAISALISWPTMDGITVGIISATFGAALQSASSAPQVLSAMAQDDILPLRYFKYDVNASLFATSLLIALVVGIGQFDSIAPVVTMFFLMFYGCVNVACCVLSVLNNPSWRPLWPYYHWTTALTGSVLCFTIMVVISWWSALLSFILAAGLY